MPPSLAVDAIWSGLGLRQMYSEVDLSANVVVEATVQSKPVRE